MLEIKLLNIFGPDKRVATKVTKPSFGPKKISDQLFFSRPIHFDRIGFRNETGKWYRYREAIKEESLEQSNSLNYHEERDSNGFPLDSNVRLFSLKRKSKIDF